MADDQKKRQDPQEAATMREDQASISRLATLLANGVSVTPGKSYPTGWDDSRSGKKRRYVAAREEHLTAARKLLGWDRPSQLAEPDPGE